MKRSEFDKIVADVSKETASQLQAALRDRAEDADPYLVLIAELPFATARAAAEIMTRSGLIQFDPESSD